MCVDEIYRWYRDLNFLFLFSAFPSLGNKSPTTTSSTSQARFISQGHTYRAVVGETLTLPCEIENIGKIFHTFAFDIVIDTRIDVRIVYMVPKMKIYWRESCNLLKLKYMWEDIELIDAKHARRVDGRWENKTLKIISWLE